MSLRWNLRLLIEYHYGNRNETDDFNVAFSLKRYAQF